MKPELIVALDLPSSSSIPTTLDTLPGDIAWFKIGLELFTSEGPEALKTLRNRGKMIFLDLKLHDIPRTVARAVEAAARLDVHLLTIHASGGHDMIKAAAEAAAAFGTKAPRIVAVTILTSLNDNDLHSIGYRSGCRQQALDLATLAIEAGADGVVCSPLEVAEFRVRLGAKPLLVTPGIRPAGGAAGDQKRIATPASAVRDGASFLVVGRPVLEAADPAAAAKAILAEMHSA